METAITELEELGAEKVSGVGSPANGTPWLLLKSTDVEADPNSPHTSSPEADAQEAEMTKAEADEIEALLTKAESAGFCYVDDCEVCKDHFGPLHDELLKRKLRMKDRRALPKGDFAVPAKAPASGGYPINDESHARNALSRASGKPVEAQVRAAVHRKYPNIGAEKERLEKSPGVPDESVQAPKEKGHLATGQSGLAGPVTAGHVRPDNSPSYEVGGKTPYIIPDEAKVTNNPPFERRPRQEAMPQGSEDMGKEPWEIEVVDKQNWVSLDNNPAMASEMPQEPSVQSANATVLDRIVCAYVALKEAMAAQKADPDGMTDPLDAQVWAHLEDVCATLKNALIDQALDSVGIDAALLKAEKNANNGGDITREQEEAGVKGENKANDVNSVGGPVDSQYVNKEKTGKKDKAIKQLVEAQAAELGEVKGLLEKMSKRPRSGGPFLGVAASGAFPAAEGRHSESVAKSAEDAELEPLLKEIEQMGGKPGWDNAQRYADLQQQATLIRLRNARLNSLL